MSDSAGASPGSTAASASAAPPPEAPSASPAAAPSAAAVSDSAGATSGSIAASASAASAGSACGAVGSPFLWRCCRYFLSLNISQKSSGPTSPTLIAASRSLDIAAPAIRLLSANGP